MARFLHLLEIHEPDALVVEAFLLSMWAPHVDDGVRCLEHRVSKDDRGVALPVEAPNDGSLRACDRDAGDLTEPLAPAERLSHDAVETA